MSWRNQEQHPPENNCRSKFLQLNRSTSPPLDVATALFREQARRATSLGYGPDDPRHGLIAGLDEGDTFTHMRYHQDPKGTIHWCCVNPS